MNKLRTTEETRYKKEGQKTPRDHKEQQDVGLRGLAGREVEEEAALPECQLPQKNRNHAQAKHQSCIPWQQA